MIVIQGGPPATRCKEAAHSCVGLTKLGALMTVLEGGPPVTLHPT